MDMKDQASPRKLAVGVIGLGHWGPNVVRNFAMNPRAELRYVCDVNDSTFSRVGHLPLPGCEFITDDSKVFDDPEIEAVAIVTPTSSHYTLARKALDAGKHVLCEKPLTVEVGQSEELCRLARERDRKIMVGFTFLCNNGVRKLKELCSGEELGRIYYLTSNRSHMGLVRDDVDVIWDLAPHDVSIFNFILGSAPEKVSATGAKLLEKGHYDVAFLTLYYPGGITGHIYVSWLDSNKERLLRIIGDKARADFDDLNNLEPIRIFRKGIALNNEVEADFGKFRYLLRDGDIVSPKIQMSEPLGQMISTFVNSVLDDEKIYSDGEFALHITRTLDAAHRSLAAGGAEQAVN